MCHAGGLHAPVKTTPPAYYCWAQLSAARSSTQTLVSTFDQPNVRCPTTTNCYHTFSGRHCKHALCLVARSTGQKKFKAYPCLPHMHSHCFSDVTITCWPNPHPLKRAHTRPAQSLAPRGRGRTAKALEKVRRARRTRLPKRRAVCPCAKQPRRKGRRAPRCYKATSAIAQAVDCFLEHRPKTQLLAAHSHSGDEFSSSPANPTPLSQRSCTSTA
jgi:hypothetical protein